LERIKKQLFQVIKLRVWKKLHSWWKGKLLSQAGREVIIEAVALALPAYAMRLLQDSPDG
jgi:hypothetical protein